MPTTTRQHELLDRGVADLAALSKIDEIVADARDGKMVILVDDEDRENEGDLYIPAQMATPAAINFMARYGRGLVCLSLTRQRCEQLGVGRAQKAVSKVLISKGKTWCERYTVRILAESERYVARPGCAGRSPI